ncbi:MAG: hypothetical protein ACE5I7_16095 [Candidatus Binatia bacterium]
MRRLIDCIGKDSAELRFRQQRAANLLTVKMSATNSVFAVPLTSDPVVVTLSAGGLDRTDRFNTCTVNRTGRRVKRRR